MATITKLQSGKFKAIVRNHGRSKTKTFTRKTDARTWAKALEANTERMAAMTLAELATSYMDKWQGRDQSVSFKVKFWVDRLGDRVLLDIDAQAIRDALEAYSEGAALRGDGVDANGKSKLKHAGRPRSAATVNRIRSTLSALFKFAVSKGWLLANPVSGVSAHTENNKRIRYLSDNERTALLAACRDSDWPRLYLLIALALTTGARQLVGY